MIRGLLSLYSPRYPAVLVYMLQNAEYRSGPYLAWFWRTRDFSAVEYRRQLVPTRAARLLLLALWCGITTELLLGLFMMYVWFVNLTPGIGEFGLALIVGYPIVWAHLVVVPLVLGRRFITSPRNKRRIAESERIFRKHPGEKIAIVGSYGKTSMKELLLTVLGEDLKVVATPANKNVAVSHAAFARRLTGDEQVLLIEYGEGAPGDVARFAKVTHPARAVITGVAAAHLDHYGSTMAAAEDIFSVARFIDDKRYVYVNAEATAAEEHIKPAYSVYNRAGAYGWKVSDATSGLDGLTFTLTNGKDKLHLRSGLVGMHNIGPLSLAAALAHDLGLSNDAIEAGIAKTVPFEHRMQPYPLNGGWVIDDTYNGNIEGIRAGTALLKQLPARRKLYATPGLVDQGAESEKIHTEMGRLIAGSGADTVVLIKHSVTPYIEAGLKEAGFAGELIIEDDPLAFYTNLGQFLAAGDLAMLQNDWPDNYA